MEQARHTETCDSRAFIIVDALSEGCLAWTRKALLHLGATLALAVKRPPPIGLAVIQRKGPKQSTQLQVLLRPGSSFQLREFHACVERVTAADPNNAADGKTLGGAVKALIEHMMKLPGGSSCHNHVFILSCKFTDHPLLQKVIQVCCMQLHASLHFLRLHGPEANLDSLPDTPPGMQDQQQQQVYMQADAALEHCVNKCAPYASFEILTADCEAVVDLLCQSWLRELLCTTTTSSKRTSSGVDMLLQLDQQQVLPCMLQQHLLQLDPWLLPAHLCPCHNIPMQPPASSSSLAAVAAAALGSDSDVATAAGLVALPEEVPWRCGVTGQPVMQDVTSCSTDASILQLGRHTQLKAAAGFDFGGSSSSSVGHSAVPLAALALPPGQPCLLKVEHVVGLHQIDSMMIYGMPLVAMPAIGSGGSSSNAAARATEFAGQQQQGSAAEAGSSGDAGMLMRVVCQLLLEQQQVLLACSSHNVYRRCHTPLQQWYVLQPAADGCSLLLRCMASREQLLPPQGYQGVKQVEGPGGEDEEVVLLDADQLEAVRSTLAGLGLRSSEEQFITEPAHLTAAAAGVGAGITGAVASCLATAQAAVVMSVTDTCIADGSGGAGSGGASAIAGATAAGGFTEGMDITASHAADVRPVAPTTTTAAAAAAQGLTDSGGSSLSSSRSMPLMLSCGLHGWVTSVLANTTGTYIAPVMPAAPAATGPVATVPAPFAPPHTAVPQQQQQLQQSCAPAITGPGGAGAAGQPPWQQGQQQGLYQQASHGQQQEAFHQPAVATRRRSGGQSSSGISIVTRSGAGAAAAAATPNRTAGGKRGTGRNALKLSSSNTGPGR